MRNGSYLKLPINTWDNWSENSGVQVSICYVLTNPAKSKEQVKTTRTTTKKQSKTNKGHKGQAIQEAACVRKSNWTTGGGLVRFRKVGIMLLKDQYRSIIIFNFLA